MIWLSKLGRDELMYDKDELLKRIEINPKVVVGKPVIKGTRITVVHILGLLADGMSPTQIVTQYKRITEEDIAACLFCAQAILTDITYTPLFASN